MKLRKKDTGFTKIKVKVVLGSRPEGMGSEWMTEKDWKDFDEYVEKLKRDGLYGKTETFTLLIKKHPFFDAAKADESDIILDLTRIEKHIFKPLQSHSLAMDKPKFVGHVVSGGPVTTTESKKAGIIKTSEAEKKDKEKKDETEIP